VGVEVRVEGLSKSFGSQNIWEDVTLTLPPGEISVMLGPSGTGKSVFLKSLVGLLSPEKGSIVVTDTDTDTDIVRCGEKRLYEIRRLFGVLFQDGALFGSMNLYDNIASGYGGTDTRTPGEPGAVPLNESARCQVIDGVDPNPGDGINETGSSIRGAQEVGRTGGDANPSLPVGAPDDVLEDILGVPAFSRGGA